MGAVSVPSFSLRKNVARLKPRVIHATESGTAFGGRDTLTYVIPFLSLDSNEIKSEKSSKKSLTLDDQARMSQCSSLGEQVLGRRTWHGTGKAWGFAHRPVGAKPTRDDYQRRVIRPRPGAEGPGTDLRARIRE